MTRKISWRPSFPLFLNVVITIQGASSSLELAIQFMPFSESMDPIPNQPQATTCSKSIMPIMINTKLNWMDATCQMMSNVNSIHKIRIWFIHNIIPRISTVNLKDATNSNCLRLELVPQECRKASKLSQANHTEEPSQGEWLQIWLDIYRKLPQATFTLNEKLSWEVRNFGTVFLGTQLCRIYSARIHTPSLRHQVKIFRLQSLQEDTSLKRRKMRVLARLASVESVWNLKQWSKLYHRYSSTAWHWVKI